MSVFYRDIDVKISNYKSELSKPLVIFERDRGLEIYFNLIEYAYRLDKHPANLLENLVGAYATVTLVNPDGYEISIDEVEITEEAKVKFVITEDLTDELTEIGIYQLQIHVNNDIEGKDTSVFSVPPFNFEVRERLKGKKSELFDSEGNRLIDEEGYQLVSATSSKIIKFSAAKINEYLKSIPTIQGEIKDLNSQLDTNANDIKNIAVSVKNFNADDKGILDSSKSFEDANTFNNSVYVANGTFRISRNTNIGTLVVGKNGYILVDDNIVFTVDTVVCNKTQLVFKGNGKISIRDNTYSVAWYEGNTVNKKWDFLRKDFESGKPYTVVFPVPDINDSAYHSSTISPHAWKLDAPLIFDDAENIGKVYFESELYAVNSVDKMVYFSPLEKTEDIDFPLGIKLNGNNLANYGLYFDGGARLKFYNTTRIIQCGTNVYAPCNTASIDEVEFKFLNVTGFKNIGVHFDCKNIGIGVKIDYLFSNGCQAGGTNILLISGILRGFNCNKFMQVIGTPYVDVTDSNIKITPNAFGSCRLLIPLFNEIIIYNSKESILKALGNSNFKVSFIVNKVSSMTEGTTDFKELILLDKCENCTIENVTLSDSTKNYIEVRENCKNIRINNTPSKLIKKPVNCEELYINGEKYAYVSLNNETVAKLYHPSNGLIKISSNASNLYGLLMCNTATIQNLVSSDLINVTTGVLTGTSGVNGKLNISFNGNYIYIENRVGNPRNLIIGVSDLNNQLQ